MSSTNEEVPSESFVEAKLASRTLETHWKGCIPVILTLASTSISSPTIPPAVHVLVPRNSYLHVGLKDVVRQLYPFALVMTTSFQRSGGLLQVTEPEAGGDADGGADGEANDDDAKQDGGKAEDGRKESERNEATDSTCPSCWFQDADTKVPLKWHLPVSVLFDTKLDRSLPWRLTLHFANYPAELLPFDSTQLIFQHSLKQALTIATGLTKKTAMQLNKESHERLWQAVATADFAMYRRVDLPLVPSAAIPVRLVWADDRTVSTIQHHVPCARQMMLTTLLQEWLPEKEGSNRPRTVRICGVDIDEDMTNSTLDQLWRHCRLADQFLYIVLLLL